MPLHERGRKYRYQSTDEISTAGTEHDAAARIVPHPESDERSGSDAAHDESRRIVHLKRNIREREQRQRAYAARETVERVQDPDAVCDDTDRHAREDERNQRDRGQCFTADEITERNGHAQKDIRETAADERRDQRGRWRDS